MTARQALWALIAISTSLRLGWAASLGPGNDEAYHYLFALHTDWSYIDHPPMLAAVETVGLMLAGGRALDAAATRRASHDLRALLERAPRFARRRIGDHVQTVGLADVHGDVIEPPTATDHVVGQTRRVTGHLEQQQADVVPDGVRHRCEATERHAVRVVDHHGSEAEHVLVEAAEAVEVGGDECGVAEPGSVVAGCVHAVMVASRTSARHRWKHATSAPCAGRRPLPRVRVALGT